jgi:hypothetical protein
VETALLLSVLSIDFFSGNFSAKHNEGMIKHKQKTKQLTAK